MRSLPLRAKFGLYSALLTTGATVGVLLAMRPILYKHQLAALDQELTDNAAELVRDIEHFKGPALNFRKPLRDELIPVSLRRRYYEIEVPGQESLRSPNLRDVRLTGLEPGLRTMVLFGRNARIGSFRHGYLTIHIGTRLGTLETMQEDMMEVMLKTLPVVALAVFGGGWWLGGRALRPVTKLTEAAEAVSVNDPERRLPVPEAKDEIHRLTEVLNATFARLQGAYAAAARFSADASHQLKTPVAVLRAGLESLRDGPLTADQAEEVAGLLKQTRRLTTLVEDLLLLAQADAGRLKLAPEALDMGLLVATLGDDLSVLCADRGLTLEAEVPDALVATGDARRVAIILQNLGENAVKYAGDGGTVRLSATREGAAVVTRLANTGPAVPDEQRDRLFERFHRGAVGENIKGHGLGLNIARALALAMGGDVQLESSDGQWTVFSLRLPAADAA